MSAPTSRAAAISAGTLCALGWPPATPSVPPSPTRPTSMPVTGSAAASVATEALGRWAARRRRRARDRERSSRCPARRRRHPSLCRCRCRCRCPPRRSCRSRSARGAGTAVGLRRTAAARTAGSLSGPLAVGDGDAFEDRGEHAVARSQRRHKSDRLAHGAGRHRHRGGRRRLLESLGGSAVDADRHRHARRLIWDRRDPAQGQELLAHPGWPPSSVTVSALSP